MHQAKTIRQGIATRIREVRIDCFGDGDEGVARIASALELPEGTWRNYEAGVTMPAEILLGLIELTEVDPRWLLRDQGERYSGLDFGKWPRSES